MRTLFALALAAMGGCGFEHGAASSKGDDMPQLDGSIDGMTVNPGAEPTPCMPNFLDLCGQPAATMTLDSAGVDTINTDTDPRCRTFTQSGGGPVCLVYVTSASIGVVSFRCRQCWNVPAGVFTVSSVETTSTRSMATLGAISW